MVKLIVAMLALIAYGEGSFPPSAAAPYYESLAKATYPISDSKSGEGGGGTAFFLQIREGRVVLITNAHVCGENKKLWVMVGTKPAVARVTKINPLVDLCMLTVKGITVHPSALRLGRYVANYESVYVYSYPGQYGMAQAGHTLPPVKAVFGRPLGQAADCRPHETKRALNPVLIVCEHRMKIRDLSLRGVPGMSGSPVVDRRGEVVGVILSFDNRTGQAGMVLLESLKEFLK